MEKSIHIIEKIVSDTARLIQLINHLPGPAQCNQEKQSAVEGAGNAIRYWQKHNLFQLFRAYDGQKYDFKWQAKFSEDDEARIEKADVADLIEWIESMVHDIQKELLTLPGEDGCDEKQNKLISAAMNWMGYHRGNSLGKLKKVFEQ